LRIARPKLKSLHFDGYMISDFDLIALFLQHAPNLEKLTLTHREVKNTFYFATSFKSFSY